MRLRQHVAASHDRPRVRVYGRAVSARSVRLRHAGHLRSLAGARRAQARSGPRAGHPVPIGRRDDLHVPSEVGNQVLKRPAAAGERLPPGDRTAVFKRLAGSRLLPRHRGNRRVPRARGGLRSLQRHRHRRPGRHGHVPPRGARSRLPLQAHRLRLLGADPAETSRIATWDPHRCRAPVPTSSRGGRRTVWSSFATAFFAEWSHAAQPDGNPDRIVWSTEPSRRKAVRAVQEGRADWFYGLLAAADSAQTARGGGGPATSEPAPPDRLRPAEHASATVR